MTAAAGEFDQEQAHLDMTRARERFEGSTDFTIGLEEEFAIVDPETLDLRHRFEDLYAACMQDELLAESAIEKSCRPGHLPPL